MPTIGTAAPSPLAAGGTTGQALAKTANADFATGWVASPSGGGAAPIYCVGQQYWYDTRIFGYGLQNSSPVLGVLAGQAVFVPFYNASAVQVDGFGIFTNGATTAGTTALMGFYALNSTGSAPGSLIAAGSAAYSAAGSLTTLVTAFTLPAGWVFAAIGCSVGNLNCAWVSSVATRSFFPTPNAPSSGGTPTYCSVSSGVGAALADNPGPIVNQVSTYAPVLWYRVP